jgi:hypothetical protein
MKTKDLRTSSGPRMSEETRARLAIAKVKLRLGSADATVNYLLDLWEKNGGSGRDGGVRD